MHRKCVVMLLIQRSQTLFLYSSAGLAVQRAITVIDIIKSKHTWKSSGLGVPISPENSPDWTLSFCPD